MRKPTVTAAITPPPPPTERTITLTMNEDVARTLLEMTMKVAGVPNLTRRGHMDAIGKALRAQGVAELGRGQIIGAVTCKDEPVDA